LLLREDNSQFPRQPSSGASLCCTRSCASSWAWSMGNNSTTSSSICHPGTGDIALSLVQTVPLTGAVVVSTPSDVSLQDARKSHRNVSSDEGDVVGVVENMSYFTCPHCQHEVDIFSRRWRRKKMAAQFGVPFLGNIALDPGSAASPRWRHTGCSGRRKLAARQVDLRIREERSHAHAEIKANAPAKRDPDPVGPAPRPNVLSS